MQKDRSKNTTLPGSLAEHGPPYYIYYREHSVSDGDLLLHQVLGRLASQISTVVQGKDKPTYTPNHDEGDMCIVINAKDVCVTGRKLTDKFYHWHAGYLPFFIFLLLIQFHDPGCYYAVLSTDFVLYEILKIYVDGYDFTVQILDF